MGLSVASASFPCVLLVTFSYISYSPGTFVVGGGGSGDSAPLPSHHPHQTREKVYYMSFTKIL